MRIRSCIFDLDGTLLDTVASMNRSMNDALQALGYPKIGPEETKRFVGNGYRLFAERALQFVGSTDLSDLEELGSRYRAALAEHAGLGLAAYDGIPRMLSFLKERGIRLAVLSNKPHERTLESIERVFGEGLFDRVYGEREGIPLKPDPSSLFSLLEELQTPPQEALYFGDSEADMKVGKGAGVKTVAVLWGFRSEKVLESFSPDFMLAHPDELKGILESMPEKNGKDRGHTLV